MEGDEANLTFYFAKNKIWDSSSHFTLDQQVIPVVSVSESIKFNKNSVLFP